MGAFRKADSPSGPPGEALRRADSPSGPPGKGGWAPESRPERPRGAVLPSKSSSPAPGEGFGRPEPRSREVAATCGQGNRPLPVLAGGCGGLRAGSASAGRGLFAPSKPLCQRWRGVSAPSRLPGDSRKAAVFRISRQMSKSRRDASAPSVRICRPSRERDASAGLRAAAAGTAAPPRGELGVAPGGSGLGGPAWAAPPGGPGGSGSGSQGSSTAQPGGVIRQLPPQGGTRRRLEAPEEPGAATRRG